MSVHAHPLLFILLHSSNLKKEEIHGLSMKVRKGEWWMPRLIQAMKDVISCDKRRVGANDL